MWSHDFSNRVRNAGAGSVTRMIRAAIDWIEEGGISAWYDLFRDDRKHPGSTALSATSRLMPRIARGLRRSLPPPFIRAALRFARTDTSQAKRAMSSAVGNRWNGSWSHRDPSPLGTARDFERLGKSRSDTSSDRHRCRVPCFPTTHTLKAPRVSKSARRTIQYARIRR